MDTPQNSFQDSEIRKDLDDIHAQNASLLDELQSLHQAHHSLQLTLREKEDNHAYLRQKLEEAHEREIGLQLSIEGISIEKEYFKNELFRVKEKARVREEEMLRTIDCERREKACLEEEIYEGVREREDLVRKIDVGIGEKERLLKEIDILKHRNEELQDNTTTGFRVLCSIRESLKRVNKGLCNDGCEEESEEFLEVLDFVWGIAKRVEEKLSDYQEIEELLKEIEDYKRRDYEIKESLSRDLEILASIKLNLMRVSETLNEKNIETGIDHVSEEMEHEVLGDYQEIFHSELDFVLKMMKIVEEKLNDFQNKVLKEKRELENSVVSLTEENRDVNTLLRIALIEKEAVEKNVNKLKGNNEQKRVPLLQFAERGLQRVGFGFIMGGNAITEQSDLLKKDNEQASEKMTSSAGNVLDLSSECDEEVVSLASTVGKMMKNLRYEIIQLKKDLEESRSEVERLQCLTEKQYQQITEQTIYIKELEYQESTLSQNVEEFQYKIKATQEDVDRWREACELEVEAGKDAIEERDKLVGMLKRELDKTKASLEMSKSKLKLKEKLAEAAIAAQSAAESSLQLADSRAVALRRRIEELLRQLEEAESRERKSKRKFRRICWPWQAFKTVNHPVKRVLPEMQALLHHKD